MLSPSFSKDFWIFSTLLLCLAFVAIIPEGNAEHPKFEDCKKSSERYFKKHHKLTMECHAGLKDASLSPQEQFEKFGCTVKCLLKKDKMLNEDETVTEDLLKANYKGIVIPEFEEKLLTHFLECKNTFGGDKLDKTEKDCKSYKAYGLCMQEAISHVCYENPW